jgi:hypothetical protein
MLAQDLLYFLAFAAETVQCAVGEHLSTLPTFEYCSISGHTHLRKLTRPPPFN